MDTNHEEEIDAAVLLVRMRTILELAKLLRTSMTSDDAELPDAADGAGAPPLIFTLSRPVGVGHDGSRRLLSVGWWIAYQGRTVIRLAAERRLPAVYGNSEHAEAGGLVAYSANFLDLERRAAIFVDKILKGAKPGDLPVEQPTKFELVINLKTAKALGLTIPPSLLARADQVID